MLTVAPLGPGPVRWAARGLEATQSHSDHGKHIHHSINFSWVRRRYACEKLIERSGVGVCHDTEAFLLGRANGELPRREDAMFAYPSPGTDRQCGEALRRIRERCCPR